MKKIFFFALLILIISVPSKAEEDVFDTASGFSRQLDEQKIIPVQDYEKILDKMKKPPKKKKWRQQKELMPSSVLDENTLEEVSVSEEKYSATLMVPVMLFHQNGAIPVGFYKICAEESGGKHFLNFYQGTDKIATVEAFLTNYEEAEETINYVRLLPYRDGIVKVIYGSLEYNLETLFKTL